MHSNKLYLKNTALILFFFLPTFSVKGYFNKLNTLIEVIHLNDGDHDDDNDENAVSVIISCMKMQLVSRS